MIGKRCLAVVTLTSALVLLSGACGGSDSKDSEETGGGVTATTDATGTPVAVELGETSETKYFMKAVPDSVPAGPVNFTVKNSGTTEHEMVVMKTDTPPDQLKPRAADADKVEEEGMVDELEKFAEGLTKTITLDLEPGTYVLVCNVAKHHARGMHAAFTVT